MWIDLPAEHPINAQVWAVRTAFTALLSGRGAGPGAGADGVDRSLYPQLADPSALQAKLLTGRRGGPTQTIREPSVTAA